MREELIAFKGVKEGIYIYVHGNDFLAIKNELDKKLQKSLEFYKGTKLLGIQSKGLSSNELIDLKCILKYKYELIVLEGELPKHVLNMQKSDDEEDRIQEEIVFEGIEEGMTKFLTGTLRSGQVVEYAGNIVIMGDVNPGALIEAEGNIIVIGTLRGVAHAGKSGNEKSVVASYNLQPTQLRIADVIARSPDGDIKGIRLPEVARIKNGEVVIEPYLPNK